MERTLHDKGKMRKFKFNIILTTPILSYEIETWVDTKKGRENPNSEIDY